MTTPPELLETAQCLCLASRRAARSITRKFDHALRPMGLRATQFTLLGALALKGPQPIGALAELMGVDRTTLSRNLAVAEKKSLVMVRTGEDARSHLASITPAGKRALTRAFKAWRKTQTELTDQIGKGTANTLRRMSRETRNVSMEAAR